MAIEKYGVEERKQLLEDELEDLRRKLNTEKIASQEEHEHLLQREKDLVEAIKNLV